MQVKLKKLHPDAVLPKYAKPGDAGMDLFVSAVTQEAYYAQYHTGIAVEIPEGYVGLVFPRSSNSKKDLLLCNSVGVIDSGYRGEICLRFKQVRNISPFVGGDYQVYNVGDACGQLVILPYPQVQFVEVEELSATERGEGGFGSTGK